jgi:hypothetical protein
MTPVLAAFVTLFIFYRNRKNSTSRERYEKVLYPCFEIIEKYLFRPISNDTKEVVQKIMSKKNIDEMKDKILDDFFDGGLLSWNVRISDIGKEKEVIQFSPLENKLTITANTITLPDSAQRHTAIWGLEEFTTSIDQSNYCFPLSVSLYTFTEEQSLFSEINGEGTQCSKTRSLYLSNSTKNMLVKDIIRNSSLKNNVEYVQDTIYRKDKIVAFATLYSSLFDKTSGVFKQIQETELEDFKQWMIKFYNELIEVRPEMQYMGKEERLEWQQNFLSCCPYAWYSYAHIAKALKGDQNWKRKLQKLAKPFKSGEQEIDLFDMSNKIWQGTIMVQNSKGQWKLVNNRISQRFFIDIIMKHVGLI